MVRRPLEGFVGRTSLSMGWGYICSYYMWGLCVLKRVLSWYMKRLDRSCYMLDTNDKSPLQKIDSCLYTTIVLQRGVKIYLVALSVFEQHIHSFLTRYALPVASPLNVAQPLNTQHQVLASIMFKLYLLCIFYIKNECHSNSNMTLRNELVGVSYSITRVLCCKTTMKYILSLSGSISSLLYDIIHHSSQQYDITE